MDKRTDSWRYLFDEAARQSIKQIRNHTFLARCREGTVGLAELKLFVVQQGHYSTHFTRYLCALMSNLPGNGEILALARNLFEELGFEDPGMIPHSVIYNNMMASLGLSRGEVPAFPETENLIQKMLNACRQPNPAAGLGALCLGAEALVPSVYSDLLLGFRACGVAEENLEFFKIHVECDDDHAETIRDIMVEIATNDEAQAQVMVESGRALVDARALFFTGIEMRALAPATSAKGGKAKDGAVLPSTHCVSSS